MSVIANLRLDIFHRSILEQISKGSSCSTPSKSIKMIQLLARQPRAISNPFNWRQTTLPLEFQDHQVIAIVDVACPVWMRKRPNSLEDLRCNRRRGQGE